MSHSIGHPAAYIILAVAILGLILLSIALAAWRRSRHRRMLYLAAAFAVLALKGIITAAGLWFNSIPHQQMEVIGSLFDLALVGFLLAPLIHR